jgi:PucR-like helix-turn-helix protein/diguanylate cyclase with GGDEF domain
VKHTDVCEPPVGEVASGAVPRLAASSMARTDELVERLLAAIFTDNPAFTDYRAVTRDDLRAGCRRYLTRIMQRLAARTPATGADDVAADIGRVRAEQGVPLEAMLRTFRLGGRIVWETLLEQAQRSHVEPEVVLSAATAMWSVVEDLSSTLSTAYRQTEFARLREDHQRRHVLVEDLLRGRAHDAAFAQRVATELDLPVGGRYVVVAADAAAGASVVLTGAEAALGSLRIRSVWHLRSDTVIGLVMLDRREIGAIAGLLRPLVRGRAAMSPAVDGIAEVGLAHELALSALGTLPPGTTALVCLQDRYPQAMLAQSPDLARRLVSARLGPILDRPASERDTLLRTLTVWLDNQCSAAHAAEDLHCHRNTVLNRLQRAAALTGRDLHGRTSYVELSLALSALELPAVAAGTKLGGAPNP